MEFIEKQDIFAGNMMLIDDKGNKITYGDFEDIYKKKNSCWKAEHLRFYFAGTRSDPFFITGSASENMSYRFFWSTKWMKNF